ncbi:MAG: hypothetical protein ABL951_08325, partial [Alphaproteobacteria bacterium]
MNFTRFRRPFPGLIAALLIVIAAPAVAQQSVKMRAGVHTDYARIVFEWPSKTGYKAAITEKELVITFDRSFKTSYAAVTQKLTGFIGKPKAIKGGKEVRIPLLREFGLSARQFDKLVVIDLLNSPPPKDNAAAQKPVSITQAENQEVLPRPKPAAAEAKVDKPAAITPPTVAAVASERSPSEAEADRQNALALEQENKKRIEQETVAAALSQAKTIDDEKQASITDDGQIDFELRVKEIAGGLRLRFPFPKDVAAAVFLRGEYLWVVFDKPARVDLSILSLLKRDVLLNGEQLDDQDATVLAFRIAPGFLPRVERRHSVWQIDLLAEAGAPDGILPVVREPEAEPDGLVRVRAGNPAGPISVIDPVVGDKLVIAPVLEATQAVVENRKYVDFELLTTSQGVALVALSDSLRVKVAPGSVEITAAAGLQISDDVARSLGSTVKAGMPPQAPAYMDFERWRRGPPENFNETRSQLRANIASTRLDERNSGQMNLAQFYLAHGLAAEARGVLTIMAGEDENAAGDSYFSGLSGVTNYYLGRYDEAEKELSAVGLKNDSHAKLWLGAIKARQNLWKDALIAFDGGFAVLGKYSPEIRSEMRILAGTAALAMGEN